MSEALKAMFLMLIFAGIMAMQFNMEADKTATRQMKNSLELAVHDAGLALDESQLSQGDIVFDQVQALFNIERSLERNLDTDSRFGTIYEPLDNSFYQEDIYLEYVEFVDDSNASFPMIYTNNDYDILESLDGPSIIAVVSTKSPRYFAGDGISVRKAVVYHYTPRTS